MDPGVILLMVFSVAIGGVVRYLQPARRIKRLLRAARSWPIAELPENTLGRVIGHVRALGEPLKAPLTGRTCVYYIAQVKDREESQMTLVDEHQGVPFVIEDDTGRAIIDPTNARITLVFDHTSDTYASTVATPEQDALLARHGRNSKGFMGAKPMVFFEAVIEIGEKVAVLGSGIREPDPERASRSGYREAPLTLLRLTSSARYPLMISDDPETTYHKP